MICSICCCSFCLDMTSYVLLVFGCLLQTCYNSNFLSILCVFFISFSDNPVYWSRTIFCSLSFFIHNTFYLFIDTFYFFSWFLYCLVIFSRALLYIIVINSFSLIIAVNVFHLDQPFSFYPQLFFNS